ncbi:MAG: ATP-dependent helicase [Deltaproteobacteria bacterium]|jgi:DNA helicase-2/ATP-dependent DNA helicase PcrA|nr:ATP-dependent helicase [Deltaproteobacteria bacterium]
MQKSLFTENYISGPNSRESEGKAVDIRRDLNPSQYEAVTHRDGPLLVIAGAGSGKTRTLVYRVAYLIDQDILPENLLLLTFTRRAAQEMLWRASLLLDGSCQDVTGGTFHAIANMLLRRYGYLIGFAPNFTIIDRSDAEGIINILKSSLALAGAGKRFPTKRVILNMISKAVNKSTDLESLLFDEFEHLEEFLGDIILLRDHYEKFKFDHGLMDYDDLLVNLKKVMQENQHVQREISARFRYIMVDEYQDTNAIQAEIVRLMAVIHNNVMAVGDDSQSIYSFRGADFRNIMDFPRIFSNTRIIKLEENYRSTQPILSMTNAIIEQADEKYTKALFTRVEGGSRPELYNAADAGEEAAFIVEKIRQLQKDDHALQEMAVLFRSGFHSYKLEIELAQKGIPFEKRGGLKLTESAHIKDLLSYLRILVNNQDNLSWNRILLLLDKVGPKTAEKVLEALKDAEEPFAALAEYPAAPGWRKGLTELVAVFKSLRDPALSPVELFEIISEYYQPIFERIYYDDYPKRSRDIEQLKSIIAAYDSLAAFVDDTALEPPESVVIKDNSDRLVLSTIHSAKGLEWDTVFIISLAEGKFPVSQALPGEQWEEERRLLYVAATRARSRLYMTYPREVMSVDRQFSRARVSPFLAEITAGLYLSSGKSQGKINGFNDYSSNHSFTRERRGRRSMSAVISQNKSKLRDTSTIAQGQAVLHPFFGRGTVDKVTGERTLEVVFDRHGRKSLHLDYAKLELAK